MLSEIEFKDKKHIILDKFDTTYIMNRNSNSDLWEIHIIPKDTMIATEKPDLVGSSAAYAFYCDRMRSYGFKPFPIIME